MLGEFLRPGQSDRLAEALGLPFTGWVQGGVSGFDAHAITRGVTSFPYIAGATLGPDRPSGLKILGWLDSETPVMGVLERAAAKIFFIGDTNGIELVPQPLVDKLIAWGFGSS